MHVRVAFAAALIFLIGCKRHEEVAAITTTSVTPATSVSVVEQDPAGALSATPFASDSASAIASASSTPTTSASTTMTQQQAARLAALAEAQQFGMLGAFNDGGIASGGTGTWTTGTSTAVFGATRPLHGAAELRMGTLNVNGRLPPEVIQRIVRQNFGRFKLCYQNGLRSNPALQGRVTTKFVIDRDGSVKSSQDGGSDMPDLGVTQCVVRAFGNLSFPQPEGGIVQVVAPIIFNPGS